MHHLSKKYANLGLLNLILLNTEISSVRPELEHLKPYINCTIFAHLIIGIAQCALF
jgi:hypothetical protein